MQYLYAIRQNRLNHAQYKIETRNLTIVFNQKIREKTGGLEPHPDHIKAIVDPTHIYLYTDQLWQPPVTDQKSGKGLAKSSQQPYKNYDKQIRALQPLPTTHAPYPTRHTITHLVDPEAVAHQIRGFVQTLSGQKWAWLEQANCKTTDPDIFTNPTADKAEIHPATKICLNCQVRDKCLKTMWKTEQKVTTIKQMNGMFGGVSVKIRRAWREHNTTKSDYARLKLFTKNRITETEKGLRPATQKEQDQNQARLNTIKHVFHTQEKDLNNRMEQYEQKLRQIASNK